MEKLLNEWNLSYQDIQQDPEKLAVPAIARFFRGFLSIHPFVDGNGRVAREIAAQQIRDLIGVGGGLLLDRGPRYYAALSKADSGDFNDLEALIKSAIET